MPQTSIEQRIADELGVLVRQVLAAIQLLDEGATVPFIARYRKEVTGSLDDAQLRTLEERLRYLRELEERRTAILDSIREAGKLTDELEERIQAAETKARLEDIYLPYKPKRRTKAQIARENGLEPLADLLLSDPSNDPEAAASGYLNEQVADAGAALEGARAILIERLSEDADLIGELREQVARRGRLVSRVRDEARDAGASSAAAKFADYFEFDESLATLPSHRILAMFRGEKEEALTLTVEPDEPEGAYDYPARIADHFGITDTGRPADGWLADTVRLAWRARILVGLGIDARTRLRQQAEEEAVRVFAENLRDLLLAAPAGARPTMGLDPGLRTGVKVAVVDGTGKVVATETIYPHPPRNQWDESLAVLGRLIAEHSVELIAVGNGTASRETDKLAGALVKALPGLTKAMVSEAGASVYSASEYATAELPDLDVSLRGAVSIARRLQDPLAELVKIEPKSIGVGQYQHDVTESKLARSLDAVVEDCVNAVGVDVNTASAPLLSRVSGINTSLAQNIVAHRDEAGPFRSRQALSRVPRLGPKAFEQAAGFLRIPNGADPLDASAVHPEAYPVVRRILSTTGGDIAELIGNGATLRSLSAQDFVDSTFGLPTITDILSELEKPGRDPRPTFETAKFAEGVEKISDLTAGMVLEGVVTNVAAFGAFVDVGVHQDGLVHISAMSQNYVSDPREVVKPGDVVKARVLDVDTDRKRISLTLRLDENSSGEKGERGKGSGGRQRGRGGKGQGNDGQKSDGQKPDGQKPRAQKSGGQGRSGGPGKDGSGGRGAQGGRARNGDGAGGKGRDDQKGRGGQGKGDRDRRGGRGRPEPDGAMADALRRAGLV